MAETQRPVAIADRTRAPQRTQPLLPMKARGLCFERAGRRLIDDVSLTLEPGSFTVVMGPNGAGKTVLLRLLHGLLSATAGEVRWAEARMSDAVRTRQSMVFQRPVLLRRSVAANIDFVLRLRGAVSQARRSALLAHVGLADREHQPARALSGGEQQRLAIARALALEPELLFLDEPTASLDPASVAIIEDIVVDAHSNGTAIVFVTHDVGQARRLGGDVVFMHRGRIHEHGPSHAFFAEPSTEHARAFLDGRIVI